MPPLETLDRRQRAVLWPAVGVDQYGRTTHGAPREIAVRWVEKRHNVLLPSGDTVPSDAIAVVAEEVRVGSLLALGALTLWMGSGSGDDDNNLHEVIAASTTPDIKNRNTRRTLTLMKYRDAAP